MEEYEAAQIAILLHDIGHGPFSHALEEHLSQDISHESLSYLFMQELNRVWWSLDLRYKIFQKYLFDENFFIN